MWALTLDGQGTRQAQLHRALRSLIEGGHWPHGARLPGTRALAASLGLARNTVLAAFAQLQAEGYLEARPGSGHHILWVPTRTAAPAAPRISSNAPRLSPWAQRALASVWPSRLQQAPPAPRFDLRYGLPLLLPAIQKAWSMAMSRSAERTALDYPPAAGLPALRQALCHWLARRRGIHTRPQNIVVVSGAQQALDLIGRVLVAANTCVLLEDPHYQGTRQILVSAGAEWRGVPVDARGVRVDALPAAPHAVLFLTPAHQFPTGVALDGARRRAVLEWAAQQQAWVVEDDYDSEFRFDGPPIPALKALDLADRVIHVGTWSKALFPALRLGFLVLPEVLVAPMIAAKWLCDRGNAAIEQHALAELLDSGRCERLLRVAARQLASQRTALLAALHAHCTDFGLRLQGDPAGMHVCAWFDRVPADHEAEVLARARALDVGVYPLSGYYTAAPPALGLLLGFAGLRAPDFDPAMRRLAEVMGGLSRV